MNAGDVGSQAVYPLASKVFLIPLGKLEASGSCCTNCAPPNSLQDHYRHMMFQRKHRVFQQLLQSMVETSV
jgi:hypothetical protein